MKYCRYKINENAPAIEGVFNDDTVSPIATPGGPIAVSEVIFLPPVMPSKIVCVGRNYAEHAKELGNEVPTEPLLFLKAPSSLITEGEAIVIPPQSQQVEHEGELAIVMGRDAKNILDSENPLDYVFGYMCLNDVTARDLQRKDVQFTRAKSFDTFCAVGRFIETELDIKDIRVVTRVNGETRQDARTSQMVFPVDFLIRYISRQMTLNKGDVIATGTPSGVSKMNDGDVCEIEIEGIGILRNGVRTGNVVTG
ncbi:MAG TPA: fumarylacetoacetate hydrolase family protein [Pyrinomonadaceae bacterium]|jgi:2-keto-4-pentenoate hydratase/2-oxohepta-3-ene-1,7-dioic acid hydratase in catechol pathway|nr:fumarylacetoacetate hydrolase family protein [Pyrinomonadaceae bacterium]